jgi:hypothetical protein
VNLDPHEAAAFNRQRLDLAELAHAAASAGTSCCSAGRSDGTDAAMRSRTCGHLRGQREQAERCQQRQRPAHSLVDASARRDRP